MTDQLDTNEGWIGVDLDGTLAEYHSWQGIRHIGDPIPVMVDRVKAWLEEGRDVRILTARYCGLISAEDRKKTKQVIQEWCLEHIGRKLPVTNEKDFHMVEFWDDRCVQVTPNTGKAVADQERYLLTSDGDGHAYVIPVRVQKDFETALRKIEVAEMSMEDAFYEACGQFEEKFNKYRVEGGLTFTDPRT